jgi:hypothetical protein
MNRDLLLLPRKASAMIANAVSRFRTVLPRSRLPGIVDLTSPPNPDSLFVTLEVEKRAVIDGGSNLPSSSEEVISGTQRDIVDYHRKLQARARGKVEKMAAKLLREIRRIDPTEVMDHLRDMPSKCRNKIDRIRAEFDSKVKLLTAQEGSGKNRLDQDNKQSQQDDSGESATKASFFVIMLVVAGLVSLTLGTDIFVQGEVGSLLSAEAAIAVTIIAVVVPFLIAVVVSEPVPASRNYRRPAFRLGILLTTLLLGCVAFSSAHLIIVSAEVSAEVSATESAELAAEVSTNEPADVSEVVSGDVSANASAAHAADLSALLNAITTEPGAFTGNDNALKGFGIVLVTGLLGFVLGNLSINTDAEEDEFDLTDLKGHEGLDKLARQMRKQVNSIVDAAERDADKSSRHLQKQFKKLSMLVDRARDTQAVYEDYLAGLEESCNILLERYRQANAAARDSEIPPSFTEQIGFRLEGASRKSFFKDSIEHHRQADIEMKDFSEKVAKIKQDLWDLNSDTILSLGAVEVHEEASEPFAYT